MAKTRKIKRSKNTEIANLELTWIPCASVKVELRKVTSDMLELLGTTDQSFFAASS